MLAYAWRWYENEPELGIQKINIALVKLMQRGVQVRAIVDNEQMRTHFATLGFKVKVVSNNRTMHTKALCVDVSGILLGSHNLTKRAMHDNYEASVLTSDYEVIAEFCEYFDRMWVACG